MQDVVPPQSSVWSHRLPRLTALLVVAALLTLGIRVLGYSPNGDAGARARALPDEVLSWQQEVETWRQLATMEQAAEEATDMRRARLLREGSHQLRDALLTVPVDRRLSAARERTDGDESGARHELAVANGAVDRIADAARDLLRQAESEPALEAVALAKRDGLLLVVLPEISPPRPGPWFRHTDETADRLWALAPGGQTLQPLSAMAEPPR